MRPGKAYIFPLLFLKRLSDKWDSEHQRPQQVRRRREPARLESNFQFVLPDGFREDVQKLSENVGAAGVTTQLEKLGDKKDPDEVSSKA